MATFYEYFMASLPFLHFAGKPPFSHSQFLEQAGKFIPKDDISVLHEALHEDEWVTGSLEPSLVKWVYFNRQLKNEIAKIRTSRKHLDPNKYLRGDSYVDASLAHTVAALHRNPSLIEQELQLDALRWQFLEELEVGHYFDLDALLIYILKLRIMERWEKINTVNKEKLLEALLA